MPAATFVSFPALRLPRPALELLAGLGPGARELSLAAVVDFAGKPRSTIARWLGDLVDEHVILRIRRDEYAVPSWPTLAILLNETSAYARSLLLHHEVLSMLRIPHAFACLPVRRVLPLSLVEAAPVLNLNDKRVLDLHAADYPNAFRANYASQERRIEELRYPTAASQESTAIPRKFPSLLAETSLALFAATVDARMVNASLAAAVKLGIDPEAIKRRASAFVVEEPPLKGSYPNTLVLPRWLAASHASATSALGRDHLRLDARAPRHVAGEDS